MYNFFVILTSVLFIIFILKNLQLIYLLNKLGFYWTIVKFLIVEIALVGLLSLIPIQGGFSLPFLVFCSFLLGSFLPSLFEMTKKKHNPKKRKTKPRYMSEAEWLWLDYTYTPQKKNKGSDSSGGGWWGDSGGDGGGDGGGGSD